MQRKDIVVVASAVDDSVTAYCGGDYREMFKVRLVPHGTKLTGSGSLGKGKALLGPTFLDYREAENELLVANAYDDSISIIALTPGKVISTIFAGCCPNRLVILKGTNRGFVTNYDSDSVSVIDLNIEQLIGQIPCRVMTRSIIFNERNNMCYVANTGSNYITVIDTLTMDKARCFSVDGCPMDICLDDKGRNLYAAVLAHGKEGESRLIEYDLRTGAGKRCINFCAMPMDLVYDSRAKRFYILDAMNNRLIIVDCADFLVTDTIGLGKMPMGQSLGADNRYLHVVCTGENRLYKIDLKAGAIVNCVKTDAEPTCVLCIR